MTNILNTPQDVTKALTTSSVLMPTETVMGILDVLSPEGIERLRTLKKRAPHKTFVIMVPSLEYAHTLIDIPAPVHKALTQLWPGPLTFIGQSKNPKIADLLQSPTLGIRVPCHPMLEALWSHAQTPFVLTSANISGQLSATNRTHLPEEFLHLPCLPEPDHILGIESTVAAWNKDAWSILRPGATSFNVLAQYGHLVHTATPPTHPWCTLEAHPQDHEVFLGFGTIEGNPKHNLSKKGCIQEACQNVYNLLHALQSSPHIGIAPFPTDGLGASLQHLLQQLHQPQGPTS